MNLKKIFSLVLILVCFGSALKFCLGSDGVVLNSLSSELHAGSSHNDDCDPTSNNTNPHFCHIGHCGIIAANETKISKLNLKKSKIALANIQIRSNIVSPSEKPPKV